MAEISEELIDEIIQKVQGIQSNARGENKKCFIIDNYALLRSSYVYSQERMETLIRVGRELKEKGINLVRVLAYKIIEGDVPYILQEKARGEALHNKVKREDVTGDRLPIEQQKHLDRLQSLAEERQEIYDKFLSDWLAIQEAGIRIDASNPDNFFYEKGEGISFIDLDGLIDPKNKPTLETTFYEMLVALTAKTKHDVLGVDSEYKHKLNSILPKICAKVAKSMEKQGMQIEDAISMIDDRFYGIDLDELRSLIEQEEISTPADDEITDTIDVTEEQEIDTMHQISQGTPIEEPIAVQSKSEAQGKKQGIDFISQDGILQKRIKNRFTDNYTRQDQEEYEQFVAEEPEGAVQDLIEYLTELHRSKKSLQSQIREKQAKGEDIDSLLDEQKTLKNQYYQTSSILTDFVLKHQTDSQYISDIIEQMPFMSRAAFINESVLHMLSENRIFTRAEYKNAMDVYERNIDKEIREMLKSKSFQELSDELYLDVGIIASPFGYRQMVPKYDCINFTLYRIDEELGTGIFDRQLNSLSWGGRKSLERNYGFGRDIYETRMPPKLDELELPEGVKEKYIDSLHWAQKITMEDRARLGLSEINSVTAEIRRDLTQTQQQQLDTK